jgi:branched-chain amino acid transport system permease protein
MQRFASRHPFWSFVIVIAVAALLWLIFAPWPPGLEQVMGRKRIFLNAVLSGITLGALYFLVASGFTLVFGLMRNVNLAHGSLYLLGGYLGYEVANLTGMWLLAFPVVFILVGALGLLLQHQVFRRMEGEELRQTLVTIGISVVLADIMLWIWGGQSYQVLTPDWLSGPMTLPLVSSLRSNGDPVYLTYPQVRIAILIAAIVIGIAMWLVLNRSRLGMLIRAGVDDRDMLAASGVRIQYVFLAVFAFGAGMAGMAGIVGGTFQSLTPGEDTRFLLASLVVVIVGGMGSIPGAALGALIIGLAEQVGLIYAPTYSVVFTFLIMAVVLAFRPQGLLGGWPLDELRRPFFARDPADNAGEGSTAVWWAIALLLLLAMPLFASNFVLFQIFGWTFILGMIALSLMFLAGYGGMVSLIQMTVGGMAGYMVAILGTSGVPTISLGWPWWLVHSRRDHHRSLVRHTCWGARGPDRGHLHDHDHAWRSRRRSSISRGRTTVFFNGYTGFNRVDPASSLFGIDWRQPTPFYYLTLACAATGSYFAVVYVSRSPFGAGPAGCARQPTPHGRARAFRSRRIVSSAYTFASVIAAVGGILLVWQNAQVSPGTAGIPAGDRHARDRGCRRHQAADRPFHRRADLCSAPRSIRPMCCWRSGSRRALQAAHRLGFLVIVFFSPDGVLGLWEKVQGAHRRSRRDPLRGGRP